MSKNGVCPQTCKFNAEDDSLVDGMGYPILRHIQREKIHPILSMSSQKSTFGKWLTVGKCRGVDDQGSFIDSVLVPLALLIRKI